MFKIKLLILLFFLFHSNSYTNNIVDIAAVVNDDIITTIDLKNRINLTIILSNLPNKEEIKGQLSKQILNSLVEENLKIQEANRIGLFVTGEEIQKGISRLERINNYKSGELFSKFEEKGIPAETIINQIKSNLSWEKVIINTIAQRVIITDKQIDEEYDLIAQNAGQPEYFLSEISLSFLNFSSKEETKNNLFNVYNRVNNNNFTNLAQQFSHGSTASSGGNLGWIRENMLSDTFKKSIKTLTVNAVTKPLESSSGYHIFLLKNKRITEEINSNSNKYDLAHIFFKYSSEDSKVEKTNLFQMANTIKNISKGCKDFNQISKELGPGHGGYLGIINESDMSKVFKSNINELEVGKPSSPIETPDGLHLLMLCKPKISDTSENLKNNILNKLRNKEIAISADVLINKIRRSALIDIRI